MENEHFRFFALQYLNDWCRYDRGFVEGLSPGKSRDDRLDSLQKAAKYYKIARNFKRRPDENENRLDKALQELEAIGNSITEDKVSSTVCDLAGRLHLSYGENVISAASKLLWIRHKSPIVIYDSRANQCLEKECGRSLGRGKYEEYLEEWRKQFNNRKERIESACAELVNVRGFSLADDMADEDFKCLVGNRWFAERVFDRFLWWNAGNKAVLSVEVQTLP